MRIARVVLGCLATATLALAALTHGQAQAPSTLLIRGATIIDGVSDAPLRDRALLIEGNTIRDVLPAGAPPPAAPPALALPGKIALPGAFRSLAHCVEDIGALCAIHDTNTA